ncbi:MAG: hypothetical protein KGI97_05310, partial [Alphaproteobacteria bacterium]|nr:hypothetical protein [Alphaproteobacteria bacterium]
MTTLAVMLLLTGAVSAHAKDPAVDKTICRAVTQEAGVDYHQAPGVAYQPGVDADGNPVAPADLPGGGQIKLPA